MSHLRATTCARPIIAISCDVVTPDASRPERLRTVSNMTYQDAVIAAGGLPLLMSPDIALIAGYLQLADGVLLTGGDDIDVSQMGLALHSRAKVMHPRRQQFELALLDALKVGYAEHADAALPVLGVCLGMQLMAVHSGGPSVLIQHLPDEPGISSECAAAHTLDNRHEIAQTNGAARHKFAAAPVASWHHQAIRNQASLGELVVTAASADGVVEAIEHPYRPFYLGVQWHPERTADPELGLGVIRRLVAAAAKGRVAQ